MRWITACALLMGCAASPPAAVGPTSPVIHACHVPEAPPPAPPLPRTAESLADGYNALHDVEERNARALRACAATLRAERGRHAHD